MPLDTPPPAAIPLRRRKDGCTPKRQQAFLVTLAETRSVTRAARSVGLGASGLYRLRRRAGAAAFAAAWDAALDWHLPRPALSRRAARARARIIGVTPSPSSPS
jgi:hypothetical protein